MGTLGVHQNNPVFDTKLTATFGIEYISLPVVMDKLILVNSRAITSPLNMRLLPEVERTPVVIITAKLILVTHTITLVRLDGTDSQSKPQQDWQRYRCFFKADHVLHHRLRYN